MNRRSFVKWLGIGAATAAVAPVALCCTHKQTADLKLYSKDNKTVFNCRICKDCKAAIEKWQTTENRIPSLTGVQRLQRTLDNIKKKVKRNA
jgi:hypothetical protein